MTAGPWTVRGEQPLVKETSKGSTIVLIDRLGAMTNFYGAAGSEVGQHLTTERDGLVMRDDEVGVVYLDRGVTGASHVRPVCVRRWWPH